MPWWFWFVTGVRLLVFQWVPMADEIRRNPAIKLLKVVRYGLIFAALLALIERAIRFRLSGIKN
jgi:hypothetical protein